MFDWLPNLPIVWVALVVFAGTGLLTIAIYAGVMRLAGGDRAPPECRLARDAAADGILFALIVGFLAVGVWGNVDRVQEAVDTEASALRIVLLSDDLPPDARTPMRVLIRRQIQTEVNDEWPAMEKPRASLTAAPRRWRPRSISPSVSARTRPGRRSPSARWSRRSRTPSTRGDSESS